MLEKLKTANNGLKCHFQLIKDKGKEIKIQLCMFVLSKNTIRDSQQKMVTQSNVFGLNCPFKLIKGRGKT